MIGSNLQPGDRDAADRGDERDTAELAIELGIVGAGVGDEPAIEPRHAVPLQRVEVVEDWVELVFQAQLDDGVVGILGTGIEAVGLLDLGAQDLDGLVEIIAPPDDRTFDQ